MSVKKHIELWLIISRFKRLEKEKNYQYRQVLSCVVDTHNLSARDLITSQVDQLYNVLCYFYSVCVGY